MFNPTPDRQSQPQAPVPPAPDEVRAYIASAAQQHGIDPGTALRVAQSEGGFDPSGWQGDGGSSFYPYQLHWGGVAPGGNAVGGMGDEFQNTTGYGLGDLQGWQSSIHYALAQAAKQGWDPKGAGFHGATRAGIGNWQGINGR